MRKLRSRMVSPLLPVLLAVLAPTARATSPVATPVKDIDTAGSPASSCRPRRARGSRLKDSGSRCSSASSTSRCGAARIPTVHRWFP
jgi:hypothetical protein